VDLEYGLAFLCSDEAGELGIGWDGKYAQARKILL